MAFYTHMELEFSRIFWAEWGSWWNQIETRVIRIIVAIVSQRFRTDWAISKSKPSGRRDEELRAVGVGAGVGHAEDTWTRWAKDCELIWAEINKHQEQETKYRYCVICIYIYIRIYIYNVVIY